MESLARDAARKAIPHLAVQPSLHAGDRRAWARMPVNAHTTCGALVAAEDDSWLAIILDLCAGGVGLVLCRPCTPGTLLTCELCNPTRDCVLVRRARVVHATRMGDCWVHGCAFERPLSPQELDALCDDDL
jgi:PilZ domain-containing protein